MMASSDHSNQDDKELYQDMSGLEVVSRPPRPPPKTYTLGSLRIEISSPAPSRKLPNPHQPAFLTAYTPDQDPEKHVVEKGGSLTSRKANCFRFHGRKRILTAFIIVLFIMIASFGILAGELIAKRLSNVSQSEEVPAPTVLPQAINAQLPDYYVKVDSPLVGHVFDSGPDDGGFSPGRNIRFYYQTNAGGVQEMRKSATGEWTRPDDPIFTESLNNTGLATYVFSNNTVHEPSIMYVSGKNDYLWEKRLYPDEERGTYFWERENSIGFESLPVSGNSRIGQPNINTPDNGWGGLQLAAVYSTTFLGGAHSRVFYHSQNETHAWIQEYIWSQEDDSWAEGSQVFAGVLGSHLSAVVDTNLQILRLFYISANNTLSESWLDITDPSATYQSGISIPNLFMNPSSHVTAIYTSQGTMLYYASLTEGASNITIRERRLPDPRDEDTSSPDTLVTACDLMARNTGYRLPSLYAPIGAVTAKASANRAETIYLFWAEEVEDQQSGYAKIQSLSRPIHIFATARTAALRARYAAYGRSSPQLAAQQKNEAIHSQ